MGLVFAKRSLATLAEYLLPSTCVFCGDPIRGDSICLGCLTDLPRIKHGCQRCGSPVQSALPTGVVCAGCQQRPPPFDRTFAPFHYAFPLDATIKALKFERKLHLAPALASLSLPKLLPEVRHFDALVPVPLYRWRQAKRGYNQAQEIAKFLCTATGLPISDCVIRTRNTAPQSGLGAATRRRNMKGVFHLTGETGCVHPLIVDDVMTTGETCRALAATLIKGGAERVGVLTIAHASFQGAWD